MLMFIRSLYYGAPASYFDATARATAIALRGMVMHNNIISYKTSRYLLPIAAAAAATATATVMLCTGDLTHE